jgi:CubicO group peptidase (beta-lactamase class C family)
VSAERLAAAVDALLDELVGSGADIGLQVAVIRHGRTLVDAARGVADPATTAPVEPGTLFWAGSDTTPRRSGSSSARTLRRATGEPISALLRTHVTGPLGVADEVHFGVPRPLLPRVARQVGSEVPRPEPGSALARAMPPGVVPDADLDPGVAVAIMRNRFGDLTTAARIDQLITEEPS